MPSFFVAFLNISFGLALRLPLSLTSVSQRRKALDGRSFSSFGIEHWERWCLGEEHFVYYDCYLSTRLIYELFDLIFLLFLN